MPRHIALGIVAALTFATAASGLTFTPTADNRQTYAGTVIFENTDGDTDTPSPAFSLFDSVVSANSDYSGMFANARSSQVSRLFSMRIKGDGRVQAQIGVSFDNWQTSDMDTGGPGLKMHSNDVSAGSQSLLEILFSIDMDANYDLTGFIDAGIEDALGTIDYGSNQSASVVLFDIDNNVAIVDESVTDGNQSLSNSGQIGPGNYRFTVDASANVFGAASEAETSGLAVLPQGNIYSVSARFDRINLTLSGRDQPIPEPVTASLAFLGIGALALQTSRRRRV